MNLNFLNKSDLTRSLSKKNNKNEKVFRSDFLVRYLRKYKKDLIWLFLISAVANILMLSPMIFMLQIFDRVFISKSMITLVTITGIIIYFYVVTAVSEWLRSKIVIFVLLLLK